MATSPRIKAVQGLIDANGVTRDQAMQKYGLTQEDADWMSGNLGMKFASQPKPQAAPAPGGGLMQAQAGAPVPAAPAPTAEAARQASAAAARTPQATAGIISPVTPEMVAQHPAPPLPAPTPPAPPPPGPPPPPPGPPAGTPPPPSSTPVPDAATAGPTTAVSTDADVVNQWRTRDADVVNQWRTRDAEAERQARISAWKPGRRATVQGQIAGIVDKDSELMQMAQTRGLQSANARGLANSSMGVQAAQAALYDAAMPMATQDANTFATAGQFNANERNDRNALNAQLGTQVNLANSSESNRRDSQNSQLGTQVNLTNASESNKRDSLNAQLGTQVSMNNADNATDISKTNAALQTDVSKFNASESNALTKLGMDNDTRRDLANIEANYKMLMQSSATAGDIYKTYMTSVAAILSNKDMDPTSKSNALRTLMDSLNSSLDVAGDISNMDIPDLVFDEEDNGGGGTDGGTDGTGNSGTASNGYTFPSAIPGLGKILWDAPATANSSITLREAYEDYVDNNSNAAGWGTLDPAAWYRVHKTGSGTPTGDGDGTAVG